MGDRSQITAVALGAANEVWGVIIGGSFVSADNIYMYMKLKFKLGTYIVFTSWCLARHIIYE